ncbi:MAG: ABC transporter transmembrane domain-containing protein [Pseudomonadota bacterium]
MIQRPSLFGAGRWRGLACLVLLAIGQAVTMVVTAFATRDVFVYLRDSTSLPPYGALVAIAGAGLALFALRAVEGRVAERTGQSYAAAIRKTLFRHITCLPVSELARRRSGALALRYVGDLAAFKGWVSRGVARLISASITIPAAFFVLYLLEPRLLPVAAVPIALVTAVIFTLSAPLGTAHAQLRTRRSGLAAAMAERLPQGIALRRSGRVKTELQALARKSDGIAEAAVRRASLAATIRALPDAGAGVASALCLLLAMRIGLNVADAAAALTALALIVWPLRHLADVADRRRAYGVASEKLDRLLSAERLPVARKIAPEADAPALDLQHVALPGLHPFDLRLAQGEVRRLSGPRGCGKSVLLLALAGFEAPPPAKRFNVLGADPVALQTGRILYLGRQSPQLKGSLRRQATLGIGRQPGANEILSALRRAGLAGLAERLGGLEGHIDEGRRNLTASEQSRLLLVRGLLARPSLALIDADEIGLDATALTALLDHLGSMGAAALVVTADRTTSRRLGPPYALKPRRARARAEEKSEDA